MQRHSATFSTHACGCVCVRACVRACVCVYDCIMWTRCRYVADNSSANANANYSCIAIVCLSCSHRLNEEIILMLHEFVVFFSFDWSFVRKITSNGDWYSQLALHPYIRKHCKIIPAFLLALKFHSRCIQLLHPESRVNVSAWCCAVWSSRL
jgi:hypothetical protein